MLTNDQIQSVVELAWKGVPVQSPAKRMQLEQDVRYWARQFEKAGLLPATEPRHGEETTH